MEWITNLSIALLLTDMTGTIFLCVGLYFWNRWFEGRVLWKRFCLRVILIAYSVPVVYAVTRLKLTLKTRMSGEEDRVCLYYANRHIRYVFYVLGCIWLTILLCLALIHLYRYLRWREVCKGNIPEEDAEIQEVFDILCERMGLTGRIRLCRNDLLKVPCFTSCGGPTVMLPLIVYKKEEAILILSHELGHYKEKDMWLKGWCLAVKFVHGFNPGVYFLLEWMMLICEESCDRLVCGMKDTKVDKKQYFQTIFDMMQARKKRNKLRLFALFDNMKSYERRVLCMRMEQEGKKMKKGVVWALSACFVLGSSMTALAAGDALTGSYEEVTRETSEYILDTTEQQQLEEFALENGIDPDTIVMVDMDLENLGIARGTTFLEWDIPAGKTYMTTGFRLQEGDTLTVALQGTPEDSEYWAGISDLDLYFGYVVGKDVLTHTFKVEENGRYHFYVTNPSEDEEIHVEGTFMK